MAEFEAASADYTGSRWHVGVASWLDALHLALAAAGIERGSEVALPASTFVATLEAVTQAGAPALADVDEIAYRLDRGAAEAAVRDRASFVVPRKAA